MAMKGQTGNQGSGAMQTVLPVRELIDRLRGEYDTQYIGVCPGERWWSNWSERRVESLEYQLGGTA